MPLFDFGKKKKIAGPTNPSSTPAAPQTKATNLQSNSDNNKKDFRRGSHDSSGLQHDAWSFSETDSISIMEGSSQSSEHLVERKTLMLKEPSFWTVDDVCKWLNVLGLGEYQEIFKENSISGAELLDLDEKELKADLGIVKLGARKSILRSIKAIKGNKPFDSRSIVSGSEVFSDASSVLSDTSDDMSSYHGEFAMSVKCYYGDDIRVIDLSDLSFEGLKKQIKEIYKQEMLIKYVDAENETVTLHNDVDLKRVGRMGGTPKLQLTPLDFLSDSETRTLDSMADSVIVIDNRGYILFFNKSAEQIFGYKKKKILHKNVKLLMTESDASDHKRHLKNYLKTGKGRIIGKGRNVTCKTADGTNFSARLSVSETKEDSRHYFTGVLHKLENSTETSSPTPTQNSGNASQAMMAMQFAVLDSMLDVSIVINDMGTIQFFNKAAEKTFGYNRAEVTGRNIKMLMPEPIRSEHDSYLGNYRNSHISKVLGTGRDVPIECKDGSISRVLLKLSEGEIGGKMFFTGVMTPLSSEQLNSQKSVLEQEREVLSGLLLPAMIIDVKGVIQAFNLPATKSFGYNLSDIIGKNVNILMTGSDKANHNSYLDNYVKTRVSKIIGVGREVVVQHKDGNVIRCKLYVTEKGDGTKKYFSGVLQPI